MDISVALFDYLSTYAGLTALLSTRIYPIVLPQDVTLPAITYQKLSKLTVHTMGNDPGLGKPRYQFTCWGETPTSAKAVKLQLQTALQNQRNQLWGGESGVTVTVIGPENEIDNFELTKADVELFSVSQDYYVWHDE